MKLAQLEKRLVRGTRYPDPAVNPALDHSGRSAEKGEPRHGDDRKLEQARIEAERRRLK